MKHLQNVREAAALKTPPTIADLKIEDLGSLEIQEFG